MFRYSICAIVIFTCFLAAGPLCAQSKPDPFYRTTAIQMRWSLSADTLRFTEDSTEKVLTVANLLCDTLWVAGSLEAGDKGFTFDGDSGQQALSCGGKLTFRIRHDAHHSAQPEWDKFVLKLHFANMDSTRHIVLEAAAPVAAVETSEGGELAGWIADGLGEIKVLPPQPNPSREWLNVSYAIRSSLVVTFAIFSETGRRELTSSNIEEAGIHDTPIDVHTLPSGNYLLQITAGNSMRTFKIAVQ